MHTLFNAKQKSFARNLITIACLVLFGCDSSTIINPTRKNIYETVYASGKITAADEHIIFATINGTVVRKMVHDGDTVNEQQPLFQIHNIAATSALRVSADKIHLLQQFSSADDVNENNFIRSDCNGIIYHTMIEQGEVVHLNEPLALVGDAQNRIVQLAVDQQDINKIKPGQLVLVKTDITGDTIYKASVIKIYSLMNETQQSFRVDATFNENFSYPFIHNAVEANIVVNEKKNALVIPRNAIEGKDSLWIKTNDKTQKIKVETGIKSTDYIEIVNGIVENTKVVIKQIK
jgi:multidrug efflux pump subunit AcrA (membrane-fusion protein)